MNHINHSLAVTTLFGCDGRQRRVPNGMLFRHNPLSLGTQDVRDASHNVHAVV